MTISVSCDACGKSYKISDDKAGRRFRCKGCGELITVPELEYEDEWDDDEYEDDGYGDDEYGDDWGQGDDYGDDLNPYASPAASGRSKKRKAGSGGKARAKSRLIGPAICLYIVGGLSALNHGVTLILVAMGHEMVLPGLQPGPGNGPDLAGARMIGGIVGGIIGLTMDLLVIVGAYNMHTLKSHSLAMTGAIVACIPCCVCLVLGMPFGIWSLVVLNDSDVKAAFG